MLKRIFDVVVAAVLLAVMSVPLLFISVAVKLDSKGPALFRQVRVGRGGHLFKIHKVRTMVDRSPGTLITTSSDHRITRVGRVLRQSKLDELPQLIDVIMGSMSLVGPRPEVPKYVQAWPADLRDVILSVRPGITDPATVELRHESEILGRAADPERLYVDVLLPMKTAIYARYAGEHSMVGDIGILFRTVRKLFESDHVGDAGHILN